MQLSTINEVADRLKLSTRKVHQLIHSGHLPKVQIGRSVRIREDDLAALVRRGYSGNEIAHRAKGGKGEMVGNGRRTIHS